MKTNRINLINCDERLLEMILKGDEFLAKELSVNVPNEWSESDKIIFKVTLEQIKEGTTELKWYSYLAIEIESKTVLGSCGYKGEPNKNGMVEIGYEIAKDYRNKGYATEITQMLIKMAFEDKRVKKIQAHTLPNKNASVRVLEKCNFNFIEEYYDEESKLVWKWNKEKI